MKVLIVAYYWPPAGGPGVQRWLKFVKYLPEFGIEPTIIVPSNPDYPLQDKTLLNEIPDHIHVIHIATKEPFAFAKRLAGKRTKQLQKGIITEGKQSLMEKVLLWIRGNFFIPDARIGWVKPVIKHIVDYHLMDIHDTLITTGPPHSVHLIGSHLKQKENIYWLADFRDPWTTIGYHKKLKLTKKASSKHLALEQAILDASDALLVTSPGTQQEFQLKTETPVHLLTNGYDIEKGSGQQPNTSFIISHTGSLLSGRNPTILWEVLGELSKENIDFKEDLGLSLCGAVSQEVLDSIKKEDLGEVLNYHGYVSHDKSVVMLRESQLILLIEIDHEDTKAIIPGKLFEYLAVNRPIVAIGPEGGDIAGIIEKTNAGCYFEYHQKEQLKKYIFNSYKMFKTAQLNGTAQGVDDFSRKRITEKLSLILKRQWG